MISSSLSSKGALLLLVSCMSLPLSAWAQQSDNFKSKLISITACADRLASYSYRTSVTGATMTGSSGVCPSGVVSTMGFWSLLGPREVPILLTVDKNSGDPGDVDLLWSGQADGFNVYRSTSPIDLESPGNVLLSTGSCSATDSGVPSVEILFYSVTSVPE